MICAFGNPLLDTIVHVKDKTLLLKYNLEDDGQKEVTADVMQQLTKDIDPMEKSILAGGCAQNAMRVFQWITGKVHEIQMFGSVGADEDATTLKNLVEADNVTTKYITQCGFPTGKTISLVQGSNRSLVAHLGAAERLTVPEICRTTIRGAIYNTQLVYIEGFFLTNREDAAKFILDCCSFLKVLVAFNLSGEYICDLVPETIKYFLEYSDIFFGNKNEFEAVSKLLHFNDIKNLVAKLLSNSKYKPNKQHGNIVVITDGANPVECYYGKNGYFQFKVIPVKDCELIDTTGAGDAFVGGFLAAIAEKKSLDWAASLGCYAASEILKENGCAIPNREPVFVHANDLNL